MPFAPAEADPDDLTFTGENELIPELDPEFDELKLLPSTMKSVKVITRFSNELSRQSVVSLDAALRARLVADVAAKVDAQLLSDTGDGITTPRGLFAWAGTQNVPVGGALTLDAILAGQGLALGANVDPARLRLFIRPADYMALRAAKDGDQRYMLQPDATSGAVASVLGLPVSISPRIPAGRAALVDMAHVVVARDVAPSVKILDQTFAQYDQQAIRVVTRLDAAPSAPEAVVTFSGITA
nr:MAG TPA: major capsid protein [Caudoviricetes sp.]